MKRLTTLCVLTLWLACGYIASAGAVATFWHRYEKTLTCNYKEPYELRRTAWSMGAWGMVGGPFALIVSAVNSGGFVYGLYWEWPSYLLDDEKFATPKGESCESQP